MKVEAVLGKEGREKNVSKTIGNYEENCNRNIGKL